MADLYSETFTAPQYCVSIKAVDGFNLLSNVAFASVVESPSGRRSLWQLLSACIDLLELDLDIADWMDLYAEGMDESLSAFSQVFVDMERLFSVYEDPTFRDILELCLRPFAGQIFQSGGALHIRRAVSLYSDSRPLSFYEVGSQFPSGWLVTADGESITDHEGNPIVTTMTRDKVDSMWQDDINILGDESVLEIVPAIRKVHVEVTNKLLTDIFKQLDIYNLDKWDDPNGALTRYRECTLKLFGNSDHLNSLLVFEGCPVQQSAYKMVFQMKVSTLVVNRSVGGIISSGASSGSTAVSLNVEYGFRIIGADGVTYYLADSGEWSTEEMHITDAVKTGEGLEKKIDVDGFPISGTFQMFIVQTLSGYSTPRSSYYQSAFFSDISLGLDTEDDYNDSLSYEMNVNAENNSDMQIELPISDIPYIPNDSLIYSLYFVDGQGKPTRMWHSRGHGDYNTLVSHLMSCALRYKQIAARRIQGEMFTGRHIDMNTVVQDEKYLHAGFFINSIELSCLEDTYACELQEMPGLLQSETPASGDDCVLVRDLPFSVVKCVKCANQIVMLGSDSKVYVYDTVAKSLRFVLDCPEGGSIYPADDSFAVVSPESIRIVDYRGYVIRSYDRGEGQDGPATYMDGSIYAVVRYYRNGAIGTSVNQYFTRPVKVSSYGGAVRTANASPMTDLIGQSVTDLHKSFSAIALNTSLRSYIFDKRINGGSSLTPLEDGTAVLSFSDYFLCLKAGSTLKIYRRDSITERTLVKSITVDASLCDHTLSEVAYAAGASVKVWSYRMNTITAVKNSAGGGGAVKVLL